MSIWIEATKENIEKYKTEFFINDTKYYNDIFVYLACGNILRADMVCTRYSHFAPRAEFEALVNLPKGESE